ncbi:MAG: OmpA family protein [Myxococcota bacterium]|nr:OmpA family protein [Deltaproteobacteria bacterium]MDQ3339184.1 OmpA family protein [Myxococcota bacterium]
MHSRSPAAADLVAALAFAVACSSSQRAEPPVYRTIDAAPLDAPADAAAPGDAFVTTLIPADASTRGRVVVTSSDGCGFVLDQIYFAPGSSEIQTHQRPAADGVAALLVCALEDSGITKLEVQGHADDKERDPKRLSEERAVSIANFLTSKGVPPAILVVVGYGNTFPVDRRKTPAARAKNRRVAFLILDRRQED